jgi:hypothetical protein
VYLYYLLGCTVGPHVEKCVVTSGLDETPDRVRATLTMSAPSHFQQKFGPKIGGPSQITIMVRLGCPLGGGILSAWTKIDNYSPLKICR